MSELFGIHDLDSLEGQITGWLLDMQGRNESIAAVDRGEIGERRWYVRMRGEEKEFTTVWITLGQRTLKYETYVMPAPEENAEQLYEHLLRRNESLVGAHFSIGIEDAMFLRGERLREPTADEEGPSRAAASSASAFTFGSRRGGGALGAGPIYSRTK